MRVGVIALGLSLLGTFSVADAAPQGTRPQELTIFAANNLQWEDAPKALPAGAKMVVLDGSIRQPGQYTVRFRLPSNYEWGSHFSLATQFVTVISGTLNIGRGENRQLSAGAFAIIPARMAHSFSTSEETVIQISGLGPWDVHYNERN